MKKIVLTSLLGIAAISGANALELSPYASIKGGYNFGHDRLTLSSDFFKEKMKFNTDNTWSVHPAFGLKFDFDDFEYISLRAEAEYMISENGKKKRSDVSGSDVTDTNVSISPMGMLLNAYVDINTGTFITPFVTAGVGYGDLKVKVAMGYYESGEYDGSSQYLFYDDSNVFWNIGLGFSLALTDNISLDAQYRYIDFGNINGELFIAEAKLEYQNHQIMVGARYTF